MLVKMWQQVKTNSTVVHNIEVILIEAGFAFFALFYISNTCQSSSSFVILVFSCCFAMFHVV